MRGRELAYISEEVEAHDQDLILVGAAGDDPEEGFAEDRFGILAAAHPLEPDLPDVEFEGDELKFGHIGEGNGRPETLGYLFPGGLDFFGVVGLTVFRGEVFEELFRVVVHEPHQQFPGDPVFFGRGFAFALFGGQFPHRRATAQEARADQSRKEPKHRDALFHSHPPVFR